MFKQEGYDLMGAAFEVYNVLGYGMAEEIYQQSLEIELGLRTIPFLLINFGCADQLEWKRFVLS